MIEYVLSYTWARTQILDAMMGLPQDTNAADRASEVLRRTEDLSRRIIECISADTFDKQRANLMHAREIAY